MRLTSSIFLSTQTSFSIPVKEAHCQSMMCPPPCFTRGSCAPDDLLGQFFSTHGLTEWISLSLVKGYLMIHCKSLDFSLQAHTVSRIPHRIAVLEKTAMQSKMFIRSSLCYLLHWIFLQEPWSRKNTFYDVVYL